MLQGQGWLDGCMMSRMRTLGALLAALAMAGCGGSDATPTDAPAEKALPTVSAATTCGALLDGDEAPMPEVIDLMSAERTMPSDADVARGYADEMEEVAAQANEDLAPHIEVVVDELRAFAESVDDLGTFDTGAMVTSLTEINNVCGNSPRF